MNTTQDQLIEIGNRLLTQDNRCTANPMFCVQGRRRIYGMDAGWTDEPVWIDTYDGAHELPDPKDDEELEAYEANEHYHKTGYVDVWETLMVAFTEGGCKEHLELNGHNYRNFKEVRIYAETLRRCPEMIAIREWLMSEATKATGGTAS